MKLSPLRRALSGALALSLIVAPIQATWSIVIIDASTGEVCVATATCLTGIDIQDAVPVIVVGRGAAAAQALLNPGGANKIKIWDGLHGDMTPQEILNLIEATDSGWQQRQFGIARFGAPPAVFTGNGAQPGKKGLAGTSGDISYSMQGNVLTKGALITNLVPVVLAAPGDLGQKAMAGMEYARTLGGDGRCSCSILNPTSCGMPPPGHFKSAHVATIVLARVGDQDGICNGAAGCANGPYYLSLNVIGQQSHPDPVKTLKSLYDTWRLSMQGNVDGVLTQVDQSVDSLPANGSAQASFTVWPFDLEGTPIAGGGASVTISNEGGAPFAATPGPVTQNADGSYSFTVTAGLVAGTDRYVIAMDDGQVSATLYPFPELRVEAPQPLHVGLDELSAAAGGVAPFTIEFGPAAAGAVYVTLGSSSGSSPGVPLGGGLVPLNPDAFTDFTLLFLNSPILPGFLGTTDANGRAQAQLVAGPGQFAPGVGLELSFAAVALTNPETITNAVQVELVN